MKQSVQELIRLCLKKDPSAWEEFVKRYSPLVYWAIERSFKRHHFPFRQEDLEDTFQQLFSHLWEKGLRGALGMERLEGWLAIVAYRISIDVVRREKKRSRTVSFEERLPEKAEGEKLLSEILPDTQKDPRSTLEGKLVGEAVHGVLNVLTEKESSVLRLNLIEEKTHSEISDLLKIPIGTVSSLVKRTKEKVASVLKKELEGGKDV